MRKTAYTLCVALMVAAGVGTGLARTADPMPKDQSFLLEAAAAQEAEISLGRMATERAKTDRVKQFGQRMIDDHQRAGKEVSELAPQMGIKPIEILPMVHKDKAQQLSQLTGEDFDRSYITYMFKDHLHDVTEFEQNMQDLKNPQVQQWASATLPVLKEHLTMARDIADELGIGLKTVRQ